MSGLAYCVSLLIAAASSSSASTLKGYEQQFRGRKPVTDTGPKVNLNGEGGEALAWLTTYALVGPFLLSSQLPEEGYSRGLYVDSRGDAGDARYQQRLELGYHRVNSYAGGWGGRWRLDTEKHVGAEAFWTDYIEHNEEDLHYLGVSAAGDFWREENWRADYQIGLAVLSGRQTRVGPRLAVEAEGYPGKPLFFDAAAAVTFIDGGPLGELRVGGGVAWKQVQARLSYRALIGPFRNLAGPEFALIFRL